MFIFEQKNGNWLQVENKKEWAFLLEWSEKSPNTIPPHLELGFGGWFKGILRHICMEWGEVSWKNIFKLEDNDKANDIVHASKHFQPYMKKAWAYESKCLKFVKERKMMLLELEKHHINQMIMFCEHFYFDLNHLLLKFIVFQFWF